MELLLLLTALFASITGAAAGDRGVRQVQGVTVVQAAEAAQAVVQSAERAIPLAVKPAATRPERMAPRLSAAPIPALRLAFERRLE